MPTTRSLHWGRILGGGLLAELLLIVAIVPLYAAGSSETVITWVAVAGSFVVFVPVAWRLTRTLPRPVLHGVLMGAAAALLYIVLTEGSRRFDPSAPAVPLVYYFGHALKLAGGAAGGWLARSPAPAARTF